MRNMRWTKMKMAVEKRGYAIAILIAALCLPAGPTYSKGSKVKFQFNPPPDFTYLLSKTITKIQSSKSSPEIKDVARIRAKATITESPRGYYLTAKTLSAGMTRNGRPVSVPILDMMSSIELTYDIDPKGQLQDVYGYDVLFENFRKALSPPAFEALSAMLSKEALVRRDKTEWNARIGSFVGRKVKIGDVLLANEPYTLPTGGEITLQAATQVRDWAPCHAKDTSKSCVLLVFYYDTNAEAMTEYLTKTLGDVIDAVGKPEVKPEASGVKVKGEGERVIDPKTMLIYSENITRTISLKLTLPDSETTEMTVIEKRESHMEIR